MKTLGYYNGTIKEMDQIFVPMLDRACYFGDGVYDVTYSRNHHIFALEEHVANFFKSAEGIRIHPDFSQEELCRLLKGLALRLDCGDLWIYFQVSRATAPRAHAFPESAFPNLWVMMKPASIRDVHAPMKVISAEDTRFLHCNVKSLNLLPNVLASQAAAEAGVDECILHRGETVTECAHSNLFILKNGGLQTHPSNEKIYSGTGRAHLISYARENGIPVKETPFTMEELLRADEIIVTSASSLCARVVEVDGRPVGGKASELLRSLQDALLRRFLEQTE